MADPPDNYEGRGSTTPPNPRGRLSSSARGKGQQRRSRYRWFGLTPLHRTAKVTLKVTYRGGPECWYLVEARGRHGVMPGVANLHDVMREITQRG